MLLVAILNMRTRLRMQMPHTTGREQMKIGSLFSGYGGLDTAVERHFNAETVWHAEFEDAPSKVLAHHWPGVPNHHDVSTVDWAAVEPVDIITGGFPCQDVSMAGKRAGMVDGTRSNLWGAMRTAIETIRPQYAVIENVRGLLSATAQSDSDLEQRPGFMGDGSNVNLRALGRVLGDLVDIGYDAQWYGLRAADIGAPHGRFRVFILATNTEHDGQSASPVGGSDGTATATGRRAGGVTENLDGQPAGGHLADRRPGHIQRPETTAYPESTEWREQESDGLASTPGSASELGERTSSHALTDSGSSAIRQHPGGSSAEETGASRSHGSSDPHREQPATNWGPYEPAIRRWERVLGRPAPAPTELSAKGKPQLSPVFVEWMMGLNQGHVTSINGISRANQLKMLGNGVVPQQALAALQHMTRVMSD